ncbi:hypothetical protein C2845_PM01G35070 [Panicum miliaceum]|uniref:DUF4220 domain-containing protein n=1 Tax=Panicum miliaceum TaxID=4540 RepID=A0A3L6TRW0_PANMI|nr:hypothetical protein C2845_PM01G35070 [Panicum miliaceum]
MARDDIQRWIEMASEPDGGRRGTTTGTGIRRRGISTARASDAAVRDDGRRWFVTTSSPDARRAVQDRDGGRRWIVTAGATTAGGAGLRQRGTASGDRSRRRAGPMVGGLEPRPALDSDGEGPRCRTTHDRRMMDRNSERRRIVMAGATMADGARSRGERARWCRQGRRPALDRAAPMPPAREHDSGRGRGPGTGRAGGAASPAAGADRAGSLGLGAGSRRLTASRERTGAKVERDIDGRNRSRSTSIAGMGFTLQVALLILAEFRRRVDYRMLRFLVWSAYMLADGTAIYVLGHLSATSRSPGHELMAFWAPFLLLHLGGQDNITAYTIEDNRLWLRHLQTLAVQVAAAAYVIYESSIAGSRSLLLPATILMFVVSVIKYGERVWALRVSSEGMHIFLTREERYKVVEMQPPLMYDVFYTKAELALPCPCNCVPPSTRPYSQLEKFLVTLLGPAQLASAVHSQQNQPMQ